MSLVGGKGSICERDDSIACVRVLTGTVPGGLGENDGSE